MELAFDDFYQNAWPAADRVVNRHPAMVAARDTANAIVMCLRAPDKVEPKDMLRRRFRRLDVEVDDVLGGSDGR